MYGADALFFTSAQLWFSITITKTISIVPFGVGVGCGLPVGVAVGTGTQPLGPHASQQLGNSPAHAVPPRGARQWSRSRLMWHEVTPRAVVRQQATAPAFPQDERVAHRCT